jgi:hypothetical protein
MKKAKCVILSVFIIAAGAVLAVCPQPENVPDLMTTFKGEKVS